jgi:hypothetical protein
MASIYEEIMVESSDVQRSGEGNDRILTRISFGRTSVSRNAESTYHADMIISKPSGPAALWISAARSSSRLAIAATCEVLF